MGRALTPFELVGRRHQQWGWRFLLLYVTLGSLLEFMHGFKFGYYLDPENSMRRELWTLAHAHGTLISLIHLAFSASLANGHWCSQPRLRVCSLMLKFALVFIPTGFFLGGLNPSESDPGIGIWLVPLGATFLIVALVVAVVETTGPRPD